MKEARKGQVLKNMEKNEGRSCYIFSHMMGNLLVMIQKEVFSEKRVPLKTLQLAGLALTECNRLVCDAVM